MASAGVVLILGLIVYFIVYNFYAKQVDKKLIQSDPSRATPAVTYMDGVEYFPTNKFVLFGFQFKSVAGLSPVVGPITAIMWGWLPGLLWILIGNTFIGWVQDYFSAMVSVRSEGQSFGPITHRLIGPRTRKVLLLFISFYLILVTTAFANLGAGAMKANIYSVVPTAGVLIGGLIVGYMIYKMKLSPMIATAVGLAVIVLTVFLGSANSISIENLDVWLLILFAICLVAANTPIWSFTQPVIYLFFYVVYFGLIALIVSMIFSNPEYVRPAYTTFWAGAAGAELPLWPLMFVTIACGSISGWHSLVSSSSTSKQIENERDVLPVTAGSMLSEGMLAILAVSIVAVLSTEETKGLGAPAIFSLGASKILGAGTVAKAYVGLIFIALTLAVMMLSLRIARMTLSELAGEYVPAVKNKYVSSLLFLAVCFVLASPSFGATWIYIWTLFGGSNQLMAGLALMIATLWLIDTKKPYLISGIPGIFMLVTTISALIFSSYRVFMAGSSFLAKGEMVKATGNILAGVIGSVLVLAALVMLVDIWKAYTRMTVKYAAPAAADGGERRE